MTKLLVEKQTLKGATKEAKEQRKSIITSLYKDDFKDAGCYSRAGLFQVIKNTKGFKVIFGKRCNFGGANIKYFSLVKYFSNEEEALNYVNKY